MYCIVSEKLSSLCCQYEKQMNKVQNDEVSDTRDDAKNCNS